MCHGWRSRIVGGTTNFRPGPVRRPGAPGRSRSALRADLAASGL